MAVSKAVGGRVVGIVFEPENLPDVLNLDIFYDGFVTCVPDVEQFAPQREHAIVVTSDDTETRNSKGLCRVSFRQNQCTALGVSASGIVGVFEFDDAGDTGVSRVLYYTHRDRFEPSIFFMIWSCLNFAQFKTLSMMPDFATDISFTNIEPTFFYEVF